MGVAKPFPVSDDTRSKAGQHNKVYRRMTEQPKDDTQRIKSKPEGKPLGEYEGETVSVYAGEFPRNEEEHTGFPNGISVNGELEYHSGRDQYRIVVSSGNYSYFTKEEVTEIRAGENYTFKDGAEAVIRLQFKRGDE